MMSRHTDDRRAAAVNRQRLITVLEQVTGHQAPEHNKIGHLINVLITQRDHVRRAYHHANMVNIQLQRDVTELRARLREAQSFRGDLPPESEDTV